MTVYNAGNIYLEDLNGGTSDQIHIYAQTDNIADGAVTGAKLASPYLALTVGEVPTIPSGSDLDTYTTPGNYRVASASVAQTLVNCPSSIGGRLTVANISATSSIMQIYASTGTLAPIYVRTGTASSFNAWTTIAKKSEVDSLRDMAYMYRGSVSASDTGGLLSHVTAGGSYYVAGSNSATFTDRPEALRANLGATLHVSGFASTLVYQTMIDAAGTTRHRIVNTSTYEADTSAGKVVDSFGWFEDPDTHAADVAIASLESAVDSLESMARWAGKTVVCFGDSRTWYDGKAYTARTKPEWAGRTCQGYQRQIEALCQATTVNEGASGETSAQICARILAYDLSGADAVFLEGGVNDWVKSSQVTIGQIAPIGSTFDTSTSYGAWQAAVEHIMGTYPQVKIFIDTPAPAWTSAGEMPESVAKVKKDVAELYGLPCLDLYHTSGVCTVNRDYYYADDVDETGWRLHFNDYGNKLVGQIIAEYINTR